MKRIWFQISRVWFDFIIFGGIVAALGLREYENFPPPLQLLALKALLVSSGFMHAHIMRKLAFPSVSWTVRKNSQEDNTMLHWLIIGLYIVIIYAYAKGG